MLRQALLADGCTLKHEFALPVNPSESKTFHFCVNKLTQHPKELSVKILVASVLSLISFGASATNLLENGDFEVPVTSPALNYNYGGGDVFPGWSVTGPLGSAVTILNKNYFEQNLGFPAQNGIASIDISGAGNTGPTAGINQTVSTEIGASYLLTFWVGNADGSGNPAFALPSTINLSIDGLDSIAFTNSSTSFQSINWVKFNYTFIATNSNTNISFLNGTALADRYAGLDNVSLSAVPEPASAVLWFIGLATLIAASRVTSNTKEAREQL